MRIPILILLALAPALSAQEPIFPGSRVRLVPGVKYEPRRAGKVVSMSSDSAIVQFEPVPEIELRSDLLQVDQSRLEVLTNLRRRTGIGAVIGGATLAITGYMIGSHSLGDICEGSPAAGFTCRRDTSGAVPLLIVGAAVGSGVGAMVGYLAKSETWKPVKAAARH
jgi:hypothetical protein